MPRGAVLETIDPKVNSTILRVPLVRGERGFCEERRLMECGGVGERNVGEIGVGCLGFMAPAGFCRRFRSAAVPHISMPSGAQQGTVPCG